MEKVAEGINFDRRSDHHDASPTHQYYPDANFCVECTEKNIAEALTQYGDQKLEEAAKFIEAPENQMRGLADACQMEYAKMVRSLKGSPKA